MKIKSIQSTVDLFHHLTPFERKVAFFAERGRITQQQYFNLLKIEFNKPK